MNAQPHLDKVSEVEMTMRVVAPSPAVAELVTAFAFVESRTGMTRTLVPDTALMLAFRYGGFASLPGERVPDAAVSGLRTVARRMLTSAGGGVILAKVRPGRAGMLFDAPQDMFARTLPLASAPLTAVRSARSDAERVAVFERFLLDLARGEPDPFVERALPLLEGGSLRVTDVARRVGLSQDALEKRFRRMVGATMKAYACIVRFKRALEASATRAENLTTVSVAAGYADQSHFNRHFRQVTGSSPRSFLDDSEYC